MRQRGAGQRWAARRWAGRGAGRGGAGTRGLRQRRAAGVRRGIGLGVAGVVLGQVALLAGAAGTAFASPGAAPALGPPAASAAGPAAGGAAASAAVGLLAGSAAAPGAGLPVVTVCGVDSALFAHPPLGLRFTGLRGEYRVGGSWSAFTLGAANRTAADCPGVLPVVVFGARGTALRTGDVRVQWRSGRGGPAVWHTSAVVAEGGMLVGLVGPAEGLSLAAGGDTAVPLRMRFAGGAPTGQWVTMAIGYEPVALAGQTQPLPVGVSDPHLFRVLRSPVPAPARTGRSLARTGASADTARLAGAGLLAVSGGTALVLLARRRSAVS
jgi:hypothetical protein